MTDKVKLQLGDLIQVIAPNDLGINKDTYYYINYIDENKIRLEEPDGREQELTLTDGYWDNESIENIIIKSRAEEVGYARQNNLINGVWIDIFFNGDLPLTVTGKITNLEEDKIEITTFPDEEVIFIDFGYKGLPEDLPIEKIQARRAPDASIKATKDRGEEQGEQGQQGQEQEQQQEQQEQEQGQDEPSDSLDALQRKYNELQKALLEMPEDEQMNEELEFENQQKIKEQTRRYIFNADQIQIGEDLESITQMIDVPEEEQRYDIDKQLDDLLDDMLSTIPNAKRSTIIKNDIHKMIQRFKQLREHFSVFDSKGYALMPKARGQNYKPLIEKMEKLEKQFYWMLPVVKRKKKIYTDEEEDEDEENNMDMGSDDVKSIVFAEDYLAEKKIVENYDANTVENDANKYAVLQRELNPYFTPFLEAEERDDIIINTSVNTTITAIVDNLGNFNSTVQGTDTFTSPHSANKYERKRKIQRKRFALETYTTGTEGLEIIKVRGDNPIVKRKELTKNDRLDLKAIMTLPEATVRFSRINLQTATLLDKSNLNLHFLNYWQLLRSNARVTKTTIASLTTPYQHDPEKFLKSFHNFAIDEKTQNQPDQYTKFLDAVIPKTKFLFNLIKPYLVGKLSINDILTYLEPFMVYQDDLNVIQYKEMNEYIREKIMEYRKMYSTKAREYASIKGTQNVNLPSLIKIFDENANLKTKVLDVYGFSDTIMTMSNSDFIKRIYDVDRGVFYNNAIALISTNLMMADGTRDMADINIYLNKEKQTAMLEKEVKSRKSRKTAAEGMEGDGDVAAGECNKYKIIAKRYIELDELNEDNGKEIYFDKKYDPTPYDIGEMFKADSAMKHTEQIQHYIGKIIKMKGLDELNARRDAESILKGKRTVESGEYAILETTDESSATLQYYVRQQETWVLDNTIAPETFADNMKMFCNLNEKCISVKDKCEDQTTGANEIKKHNLKLLLSEFNNVLNVNKDIIANKIEDELASADARIDILRNLRLIQMYKYETKKVEIANTVEENRLILVSPYDGLLNTITLLRQTDIAKYYLKISDFVKTFTREGISENDESHYWYYCIKSNKKMLPTFIYKLATTFLSGGNFALMLDKICALQGTISDDGDKYVDKYSGYTIKMIEMSADEEYNEEGFKIITRSVMDEDVGDVLTEALKTLPQGLGAPVKRKYATPDAMAIYNVIEALSTNMGVNIEDQKDFIAMNVLKQLSNASVMQPKADYERQMEKLKAKGLKVDTYEVTYNSTLLYLTFSYYLIAIQLSIPPIKTKTTFPGCVKSFSGFPLDADTTNMSGLTYVSCVAFKIKNKGALPWSAIASRNDKFIAKQMEVFITKYILATEEVQNGIKQLKLYLLENPETTMIPAEHNVESWSNFLPPLKKLKMQSTQDLGDVFKTRLSDSLRKGQKAQEDYIAELHSKMIMFSFNIIDLIEKTVHGEQAILNGKNGEPFVENACCEKEENNTIKYFVKKQPEIAIFNNKVVRLSDMYDDTKKLSKAVILYDPSNTKRKLREIEDKFTEHTIYRAFIVYCRFNTLVPLSENLKAICPTKPENFDANDSLEESIRKLKSTARNYSEQSLQQLLEVINTSTKTALKIEEKEAANTSKLVQIMAKMDENEKRPSAFRIDFMNLLETFELNALLDDSAEMRKLKNLLPRLNADMLTQITDFIGNYNTNIGNANLREFSRCLETILEFKETGNNLIMGKKEETGYKMVNFMKNSMRSLTREFPNIIMNAIKYDNVKVPSHWELSGKHQTDVQKIIKDHYTEFAVFYNDDQIRMLMAKMVDITGDINDLAQNTLFYAPVELKTKKAQAQQAQAQQTQAQQAQAQQTQRQAQQQSQAQAHTSSSEKHSTHKYSALDLSLTTLLFKFYFLSVLTDLISLQNEKEILSLPLKKVEEEEEDDESFMSKANEMEILTGNKEALCEKIASLIVSFTTFICKDKKVIDYNYKTLMEMVLRSKEKEKDEITDYLGKMTVEERKVENLFKKNKLERWSVGQQKGIHTYQGDTYDAEREEMDKIATREAKLKKRSVVTDMNRDIFALDILNEEAADEEQEREDNAITYMGEDADPEEFGMDGDENFDY